MGLHVGRFGVTVPAWRGHNLYMTQLVEQNTLHLTGWVRISTSYSVIEAKIMAESPDAGEDFALVERSMVPAASGEPNEELHRQRQRVREWLDPTDYLSPGNEYMKHLHAYLPGTARWVHESPTFCAWRGQDLPADLGSDTDSGYHKLTPNSAQDVSCLYVRGVAGSGKSVFSANTIDQLQAAGNIVLFFFFRQIVDKNHSAKYFARDFAVQLLPHSRALVTELYALSQSDSVEAVGIDQLWPIIFKTLAEGAVDQQVFCILDALDELDEADFPDMMERLTALGYVNPQAVKVMFTGRPLPKIERAIQGKAVAQLKLDPVLLFSDVARYVDARMALLEPRLSDEKCELVKQAICERASGLFLHARLVTDNLARSLQEGDVTEQTLPHSLDRLPRSLREVYEAMLRESARRSGVTADHQARILTCVTHSSRPFRLIELGSLVAQMLHVDLRKGKELVRASCGQLLELLEDETVSVIHHSFTEFLHDDSRADVPEAFPILGRAQSHDMLASICLEYLNTCPRFPLPSQEPEAKGYVSDAEADRIKNKRRDLQTQMRLSHPLALYAVTNLVFHFKNSCVRENSLGLAALDAYFLPQKAAFETYALMNWHDTLDSSITAIHLLLNDGTDHVPLFVIQYIANTYPHILDSPDPHGRTPLILAAAFGHVEILEFLLANGANPEISCKNGRTALHWAIEEGKVEAVKSLLKAGVDPFIETMEVGYRWDFEIHESYSVYDDASHPNTALCMAIVGRNADVALQFVPFIPAADAVMYFRRTRIPEVLDSILTAGLVDVDDPIPALKFYPTEDEAFERTRLFTAAKHGDLVAVEILLKHGADPTKREQGQPTTLHAVAGLPWRSAKFWLDHEYEAAEKLVQVLVDAGADVNAAMDDSVRGSGAGCTPLHLAVQRQACVWTDNAGNCEEPLSKALLKAGADPNATTSLGDTPLHFANAGEKKLIELLISHGADINKHNLLGRPPFLSLMSGVGGRSSAGHLARDIAESLHTLLDLGADAAAADNDGNNVFHYLMQNIDFIGDDCCIPLIERLLKVADPNLENQKGETPVFWYRRSDSYSGQSKGPAEKDLLPFLLQKGMRLDARNRKGEPLLHFLLGRDSLDIADFVKLVELGADLNALGPEGRTTFHKAVLCNKSIRWLKYIVQEMNSASFVENESKIILHDIMTRYTKDTTAALDLVIAYGADPLAKNEKGQAVLHIKPKANPRLAIDSSYFQPLDLNGRDVDGRTPLHQLVTCDIEVYADLLQRGADPFVRSNNGMLPFHCAAKVGQAGLVDLLLAQYESREILLQHINSPGDGLPPLHYACQAGSFETVSVLLKYGADPRLRDRNGFTPLHMLSKFVPNKPRYENPSSGIRTPEIVQMLHRQHVNVDETVCIPSGDCTIEATALDLAVASKRWEVVRELLSCGARARDQDKSSPEFILATDKHKALEASSQMNAELESNPSALSKDDMGKWGQPTRARWDYVLPLSDGVKWWILGRQTFQTPLKYSDHIISKYKIFETALTAMDFDTIKEYYEEGGSMEDLSTTGGIDYLQHLVEYGYEYFLRYFSNEVRQYSRKITVYHESRETFPITLLGEACAREAPSMPIIEWLVEEIKVNIDATHLYMRRPTETPLHILASGTSFWHLEALKYLLAKGANIEARTHDGMTPLLVALNQRREPGKWNIDAARILLEHGANVNARTEIQEGQEKWGKMHVECCPVNMCALDLAKDPKVFELLLSFKAGKTLDSNILTRNIRLWMLPETVKVLLDAGCDPNAEPSNKSAHRDIIDRDEELACDGVRLQASSRFALHEAVRPPVMRDPPQDWAARQTTIAELLLSHGADLYSTYPGGSFVLQRIMEDRGLFQPCFHAINSDKIDTKGSDGRTLLIQACVPTAPVQQLRSWDIDSQTKPVVTVMSDAVHSLLGLGADVTVTDDQGRTALHWFCTYAGRLDDVGRDAIKALIAKNPSTLQFKDNEGFLPIHLALKAFSNNEDSHDRIIRHLMDAGADLRMPDPLSGDSALHRIARSLAAYNDEYAEEAKVLFQDVLEFSDINAENQVGESVIAAALATPFPQKTRGYDDHYPKGLQFAYSRVLQFLVNLGASVDVIDKRGRNLLHIAADRPVHVDNWGNAWAEKDMIAELFKALMELGVDPRKEDDELRTPIDIAVAKKYDDVVFLFSEEGKRAAEARKLENEGSDNNTGIVDVYE